MNTMKHAFKKKKKWKLLYFNSKVILSKSYQNREFMCNNTNRIIILLISYTYENNIYIFFLIQRVLKIKVYETSPMHKYYYYFLVYLLFIITYLFWYVCYWTISITVKFTAQIISNSFQWGWADWSRETDLSLNSTTVVGSIHVTAWMLHTLDRKK